MFFVPRSWSRAVHLPSHPPKLRSLHSEVDASLASTAPEYPTPLDNLGMLLVVSSHLAATRNEKDTPGKILPCYTTFLPEKRDSCNMMKSYWNEHLPMSPRNAWAPPHVSFALLGIWPVLPSTVLPRQIHESHRLLAGQGERLQVQRPASRGTCWATGPSKSSCKNK